MTTPELHPSDFRPAPSEGFAQKIVGLLFIIAAAQGAAGTANVVFADALGGQYIRQVGTIRQLYLTTGVVPGAGESLTVDVQRSTDGGTTWSSGLLSSVYTINLTNVTAGLVRKKIDILSLLPAGSRSVAEGDMLRVVLTYVAGGTPAPIANTTVYAEIA